MDIQSIRRQFEAHHDDGLAGDASAAARLSDTFGAGLVRFVRRVLRKGTGRGYLAEFVLMEAHQVQSGRERFERDDLVNEIVARICELLTGRSDADRRETVAMLGLGEGTVSPMPCR
jgi:hypothetical protein